MSPQNLKMLSLIKFQITIANSKYIVVHVADYSIIFGHFRQVQIQMIITLGSKIILSVYILTSV